MFLQELLISLLKAGARRAQALIFFDGDHDCDYLASTSELNGRSRCHLIDEGGEVGSRLGDSVTLRHSSMYIDLYTSSTGFPNDLIRARAYKAREARDAARGEVVIAVRHAAAYGRRMAALLVGEAGANAKLQPIGIANQQGAEHARIFSLPWQVPDHLRLGVLVRLQLEKVIAAFGAIERVVPMQHQAFTARGCDILQTLFQLRFI